ncbi:MAG: MaoC family dehydratase [Rhizobiaceae bacterium]|nr:MaoC family dehydratase [Rhizobiaceae bacterium]
MTQTIQKTVLPPELVTRELKTGPVSTRKYAELTTDFNPIHMDPVFAAGTSFGQPIIHGTMGLNLLVDTIEATFGDPAPGLEIDVRFIRPVPVGTTIRAGGSLRKASTGTYDVFVETAAGERAVEGTLRVVTTSASS